MKDVRPTSGKVLGALFSILGDIEAAAFLDLFAGTGRVGIEALKRGASPVVMAEVLKNRARDIELAIPEEFLHGAEKPFVLSLELRRAAAWLRKREYIFDVIFADPPYNEGWGASLLQTKGVAEILRPDGVFVVEHASREPLTVSERWALTDARAYGETTLTFLRKTGGISS